MFKRLVGAAVLVLFGLGTAQAQVSAAEAEQIRVRQQMALMESVLARAIVNGAEQVMAEMRRVVSDRPRLGQSRVTGFRLDESNVVFTVQVPEMVLPILWHVAVREQQDLTLWTRVQQLRTQASAMPAGSEQRDLMQQLVALEQQLGLGNFRVAPPSRGQVGPQSLVPTVPEGVTQSQAVEPSVVDDPESAYTRAVKAALIDAMIINSQGLGLRPDEWLTVVARDAVPGNPQQPGDAIDTSIWLMRVKGSTIAAYQSRTINLEEARKQVAVTEQ